MKLAGESLPIGVGELIKVYWITRIDGNQNCLPNELNFLWKSFEISSRNSLIGSASGGTR